MESQRPPRGSLWRDEVDAVVDGGLGRFLGFVKVEPRLDGDTFVGWQIVALTPADTWAGVDLLPGDVVTRINGRPIEREAQAFAAFTSLKQSDQLTVTYLRDEQPRELVWSIVPRPGFRLTTAAPSAAPASSAVAPLPRPAPSAAPGPALPAKK
jgi:type II secretory pathway component PulC